MSIIVRILFIIGVLCLCSAGARVLDLHLSVASGTLASHDAEAMKLSNYALKPADVPAGYTASTAIVDNEQAAEADGVTITQIEAMGRIVSYERTYSNANAPHGPCCITSTVVEWKNSRSAREGYAFKVVLSRKPYGSYPGSFELGGPQRSFDLLAFPCSCAGTDAYVFFMRTYRGRYEVFTEVHFPVRSGISMREMLRQTVHYAEIVVKRLPGACPRISAAKVRGVSLAVQPLIACP